ncbi:dihydrolipoyllysine-residue succinyltransferase component of 2-oxoglutarate dehydrogenase complex [Geomonas silvestris]|uniref:Dihydrolipoyllysine-residue succinyltransferase component of 2-oxoglutarate dehydrogenase complex n=1 Tax=Geomonas silvestris TaxID=2740184 RepID=A0A6V8MMU6_9BACT|nr:2-oxoglutarate dehydrogenase complex dihydrolipoyllysine-residue succinyltransferase [Geomonas silvestris]GFO61320.1 dihydrolipoyllysine-residue succinyltransferase component of 2-oxoglutarate dehydrogenase complex [Geomonas silvestris]
MEIKVPAVGESVFEALIAKWLKKSGERVSRDEPLFEIETDKVTLEVVAEGEGVLKITVPEGETVKIGTVIGTLEAGAEQPAQAQQPPAQAEAPAVPGQTPPMSPSGRKLAREMGVEPKDVKGTGRGGRLTNDDLLAARPAAPQVAQPAPAPQAAQPAPAPQAAQPAPAPRPAQAAQPAAAPAAPAAAPQAAPALPQKGADSAERIVRKPMTPIRKRIAQRLVSVRQNTAMLTTFNEADMSEVLALRQKFGDYFLKRYQVKLGFMSIFVRACCLALAEFPEVNASIEGDDIVYHNFCDIGVAVGGEKGLVVPVLRSAETMGLAEIERAIAGFADKVRTNTLALADLEGGTFTISNGGVYGSLLSTPILNPPQSGVLGMHAIQERAVVRDGQIVIRPMMNLALSYDHRIVDGKGAVGFLKKVKEFIEGPEEMLL